MPYTVPKLSDFSAAALDGAVRELLSALEQESAAVGSENDWKAFRDRWMARKNGVLTQLNDLWLNADDAGLTEFVLRVARGELEKSDVAVFLRAHSVPFG